MTPSTCMYNQFMGIIIIIIVIVTPSGKHKDTQTIMFLTLLPISMIAASTRGKHKRYL